jgi:integrase
MGDPDSPMSGSTLNAAFSRIGFGDGKFTPHGLRKTASTILNEQGFRPDVIERQLAHAERNKVRAAYNHAEYLPERRQMMRHWADYLDNLAGGRVVSFQKSKGADRS